MFCLAWASYCSVKKIMLNKKRKEVKETFICLFVWLFMSLCEIAGSIEDREKIF